ncbi:amino acid permease [Mycolicibacterium aubagnense]
MDTIESAVKREGGLSRKLTAGQMAMISIGGAIGTGLFLGSKFAIGLAGPSVIISYIIGGIVALLIMGCLAEMTTAQPTSGAFGTYAECYINPFAGYLVRYCYWISLVLAVGLEISAVGEYMTYWFPTSAPWFWVAAFSAILIGVNVASVKAFGTIEYLFSSTKIIAILAFILVAAYILFAAPPEGSGFANYTQHGGFMPNGVWGMWQAVMVSIFSYLSIEMIAVTAGEAENPQQAVRRAFWTTIIRLTLFYLLTLSLMLALVPWTSIGTGGSPFVKVMELLGISGGGGIMNFVILIAALSAMNSQLYTASRMLFSLSRGGLAPRVFGTVSTRGIPVNALAISCVGIAIATAINVLWPGDAFLMMLSLSSFGAMFTWLMIFVSHYFFRLQWEREGRPAPSFRFLGFPWLTLLGAFTMVAIMVSTLFSEPFRLTLIAGVPFLVLLSASYPFVRKRLQTGLVASANPG